MRRTKVNGVPVGPEEPLTIIAGPCVAESADLCLQIGGALRDRCAALGLSYIFKASFDKANRSSLSSPRGPGLEAGLRMLERVKSALGVPVTTDVHEPAQAPAVAQVADLLQIPAFLCRQTDLLQAVAGTGKPINVKKGQFISPGEMTNVVRKLIDGVATVKLGAASPPGLILTERGTFFGYNRLVNDFVGLGDLMELGWPVCFDVTHSTQMPGGEGHRSGGRPDRAALLARCAVAAGVQALFIETHPDPAQALSDAATMLPLAQCQALLSDLARLHQVVASIDSTSSPSRGMT